MCTSGASARNVSSVLGTGMFTPICAFGASAKNVMDPDPGSNQPLRVTSGASLKNWNDALSGTTDDSVLTTSLANSMTAESGQKKNFGMISIVGASDSMTISADGITIGFKTVGGSDRN